MLIFSEVVDKFFSIALIINAILFILQLTKIVYQRSAQGVPLLAFLGFGAIQLVTISHGYFHHDKLLMYGTQLSLFACVCTIIAILYFRLQENKRTNILN